MNQDHHPTPEDLRVEYQASQSSAEHHDQLVWTVTSVLWAANLVLLGFVLDGLYNKLSPLLITLVAIVGIIMTVSSWRFCSLLRTIKIQKYQRCIQLEEILGLQQHRGLRYRPGAHQPYFNSVMVAVLVIWAIVVAYGWCPRQ